MLGGAFEKGQLTAIEKTKTFTTKCQILAILLDSVTKEETSLGCFIINTFIIIIPQLRGCYIWVTSANNFQFVCMFAVSLLGAELNIRGM